MVLWQPGLDPTALAGLASTRTYPLRSSFRPSYNMAVNLVGQVGRERAGRCSSPRSRSSRPTGRWSGIARQVRRNEEALAGYAEAMTCHLGDFVEYARLRVAIKAREADCPAAAAGEPQGSSGCVAGAAAARRRHPGAERPPGGPGRRPGPRPGGRAWTGHGRRCSRPTGRCAGSRLADFPVPVESLDRVRIPKAFNPRNPAQRRDLASTLRNARPRGRPPRRRRERSEAADDGELAALRQALRAHPCHACPEREDHARWAERHASCAVTPTRCSNGCATAPHTIARTFDRICGVLEELGYLDGDAVTPAGRRLAAIYTELDLLAAECLRAGAGTA